MNSSNTYQNDAKQVFRKCGTCSRTFAYLLDREFGHPKEDEERALDPLAGGIMQKGQQCGMLWGAILAAGAESYRKFKDTDQAIAAAISASQNIIKSFIKRTDTVNCRDITGYDLDSFFGMTAYMLKTIIKGMDNSTCFNLAEQWAPEAIQSAKDGLELSQSDEPQQAISCASTVAEKMGASDEEMTMVAGFAGGLGLSGNACGALSSAIWMKSLDWVRQHPGKSAYKNAYAKAILKEFYEITDSEVLCSKISGQRFNDVNDHSEFIAKGGCKDLIDRLSEL